VCPCINGERQGVILIRLWTEHDTAEPLRARITVVADLTFADQETTAVAGVDSIVTAVRARLDEFVEG
jgi:hypothetical protein